MIKIKESIKKIIGSDQANLLSHSKNYLIGDMANKALSFISIPIFTRLLLPEEYGILSIYVSIYQLFKIIVTLNFHGSLSRNYHEKDGEFPVFLGSISIFVLVFDAIFVALMFVLRESMAAYFAVDSSIFFLGVISSCVNAFNLLYYTYLQASQQSKKYAIISFISNVSILAVSIIWVLNLNGDKHFGRIYATIAVNCVVLIYTVSNLIKLSKLKVDMSKIKYAARFGIPLMPHAMSGFILSQFDRIMINQVNGGTDAGLYSMAYNIGMLMQVALLSLNRAWTPILYGKLRENKHEDIKKMVSSNAKIVFLCALCLIMFSKEIGLILADPAYYSGLDLIPIIVLGYVFVYFYNIYGTFAFFRKKTLAISINTLIAGVANIILNYIFIPKYGNIAAAYTTWASYVLLFVMHYINARFLLKEDVPELRRFFISGLIFAVLVTVFMMIRNIDLNIVVFIIIKLVLIALYALYVIREYMKKEK